MVKIPLAVEQINALLRWRDEHKELVRACVIPFPSCEIVGKNGVKIRTMRIRIKRTLENLKTRETRF